MATELSVASQDPARVHEIAREVLSQPTYSGLHAPRADGAEIDELLERLRALLESLAVLQVSSPIIYWSVVAFLLVGLLLLVWHMARLVQASQARPRIDAEPTLGDGGLAQLETHRQLALRRGDHAEALRLRFRLYLLHYHRRNPGVLSAGLTNHECAQRLKVPGHLRAPLAEVVEAIDEKWYGRRACTFEELTTLEASCDRLQAAL